MTAKVEPSAEVLEIAEKLLFNTVICNATGVIENIARAIDEARRQENEACRLVVQEHIDRHDDPETGTGSETCRTTFCECFGITTLVEIQSAIRARREPKP